MPFPSPDKWEPGIYFGLPEEIYHALPWCGSSDIKLLASIPQDYWEKSAMNELREPTNDDTAAKIFGSAIHTCILHGEPVYLKKYGYVAGDPGKEGVSADGLKDWIKGQGSDPKKLKDDNIRFILEEWGMILLTERQNKQILQAAATMRANPYLIPAFTGGFPEVSIFWMEEGVPCKCRIDYLKIKASVDLKSIRRGNRLLSFDQLCLRAIFSDYHYNVQAAHYMDGRLAAKALFDQGKVFCADDTARPSDEWLAKCLGNDKPGWVFVFYKADGATIAKSFQCDFGGYMITSGISAKRRAVSNYIDFMEKYGTGVWVNAEEPAEVNSEEDSKWWTL